MQEAQRDLRQAQQSAGGFTLLSAREARGAKGRETEGKAIRIEERSEGHSGERAGAPLNTEDNTYEAERLSTVDGTKVACLYP